MIVVFVVDTSPTMASPSKNDAGSSSGSGSSVAKGISRLDVAKMSIENMARSMDKRIMEHNRSVLLASAQVAASMQQQAQQQQQHQHVLQQQDVGRLEQFDEFLLLSSSLQPDIIPQQASSPSNNNTGSASSPSANSSNVPSSESIAAAAESHASCGAGGRLLVGPVDEGNRGSLGTMDSSIANGGMMVPHPPDRSDFEHELKRLRTPTLPSSDTTTATGNTANTKSSGKKFPEWAGGAHGLNAALSHGLGLLSRYRLSRGRIVEHFGMGRLPWGEHQMAKLSSLSSSSNKGAMSASAASASAAAAAAAAAAAEEANVDKFDSPLQPACLILLTDGECLRLPPEMGGGNLSLRFGNMPLREFYREPFRWDQRIFILHIAAASTPPLHKSLRALCEVTGGAYMRISQSVPSLSKILMRVAPPRPKPHTILDPLRLPTMPIPTTQSVSDVASNEWARSSPNVFVNGGPVCSFQCLEGGGGPQQQQQGMPSLHRAMILFAGSCEQSRWILNSDAAPLPQTTAQQQPQQPATGFYQSPIWCIPESHFPSKKMDTLPPRPSQPVLHYSTIFNAVGSPVFDPYFVMKALHHLDHLQKMIRQLLVDATGDNHPPSSMVNRMLQRDVYICEWLGGHEMSSTSSRSSTANNDPSNATGAPRTMAGREHFPICVRGAGRPALSGEGGDNILNIGILHVPHNWINLKDNMNAPKTDSSMTDRIPTLTLLPPDAHILIPLLIKVAEMELRILKKLESKEVGPKAGATAGLIKKKVSSSTAARAIHLDDNWKAEFRAYLFRLPPYYLPAIRRVLRPMLPPSVLSLLNYDSQQESLPSMCFSPTCLLKIQQGEKAARDGNDWLRGMEQNLRMRKTRSMQEMQLATEHLQTMGRNNNVSSTTKGLHQDANSLSVGYGQYDPRMNVHQYLSSLRNLPPPKGETDLNSESDGTSSISLLPPSCLLPYYESRRRWIFGGTGLTTRGLHVEGVNNDGVNTHYANQKPEDEPLIALAGVGANTTNQTSIARMGDFKERLNFSPATFVDYGGSSAVGASVTTSSDGSPTYSVDDDALPLNFFDAVTGEFVDSESSRARSRLMINFGNPFHDKRARLVVPEKFASQRPPVHVGENGPSTPPGSPPHDAYDSHSLVEGEGEADFIGKRPASPSPPRGPRKLIDSKLLSLKQKRAMGPPLETGESKRRKATPPQEGIGKHADVKSKPRPPTAPSSPHPPPPRSRPPPPRRNSSSAPPPPPKPTQARPSAAPPPPPKPVQSQKPVPQKPAAPKPAPPKRQKSKEALPHPSAHGDSQQPQMNQTQKKTPQKPGKSRPAPPKRQGEEASIPIAHANSNPPQQDIAAQLQNPSVKPKLNLPEGWICVWSKSQKRWYFFDKKTNKSVWDIDHIKAT